MASRTFENILDLAEWVARRRFGTLTPTPAQKRESVKIARALTMTDWIEDTRAGYVMHTAPSSKVLREVQAQAGGLGAITRDPEKVRRATGRKGYVSPDEIKMLNMNSAISRNKAGDYTATICIGGKDVRTPRRTEAAYAARRKRAAKTCAYSIASTPTKALARAAVAFGRQLAKRK